jgi:hypothetical protein
VVPDTRQPAAGVASGPREAKPRRARGTFDRTAYQRQYMADRREREAADAREKAEREAALKSQGTPPATEEPKP